MCDSLDGSCQCFPGYEGDNCLQKCDDGKFGPKCESQCDCKYCDHISGVCSEIEKNVTKESPLLEKNEPKLSSFSNITSE